MALRARVRNRFGRDIHCHRLFLGTKPIPGKPLQKVMVEIGRTELSRAVMSWLARSGPFWDDDRHHGESDWLASCGEIVTDSAIAEAAYRILHGVDCGLVSLTPSKWCRSPIEVTWVREDEGLDNRDAEVENWWCATTIEGALKDQEPPLRSWSDIKRISKSRFEHLSFTMDCFSPLQKVPFSKSAADQFLRLLTILDRFAGSFDSDGKRSAEGHQIYLEYFTGDRALFSDSSSSEKKEFGNQLIFVHPDDGTQEKFTWHGKIPNGRLPLRFHFSWPVRAGKPIHVVYAGPKITRR